MAITYHAGRRIQGTSVDRVGSTGNQGYAGGAGVDNASGAGGGGGGAGAVGADGSGNTGGNGGAGLANPIVGSSAGASGYFAGGGGGAGGSGNGSGGTGGGGAGNWSGTATAGQVNTGSGGGSGGEGAGNTAGNDGGSGIVILKFLTSGTSYSTTGSPAVDTSTANYTILTYTSTSASSFTISSGTPDVQYLVVAGGGGGAAGGGGAGGAGGYRTGTLSLSSSTGSSGVHTVTVGNHGAGGGSGNDSGIQGSDSVFDTITSTGGGLGRGAGGAASDANGGSGGGGGKDSGTDKGGGAGATYVITPVTIPTNVQVGSRFEETDTRKMYHYEHELLTGLKAHYDFSQTSGNLLNVATNTDSLGSSGDLTTTGTITKTAGAWVFGGGSAQNTTNALPSTFTAFTMNMWIQPNANNTSGYALVLSAVDGNTNNFSTINGSTGGKWQPTIGAYSGSEAVSYTTSSMDSSAFQMVTMVYNGALSGTARMQVYFNGSAEGTPTATPVASATASSKICVAIQGNSGQTPIFLGTYKDVSIWDRALTGSEITKLYNAGTAISPSGILAWKEEGT